MPERDLTDEWPSDWYDLWPWEREIEENDARAAPALTGAPPVAAAVRTNDRSGPPDS
jgi:hypothetical protein